MSHFARIFPLLFALIAVGAMAPACDCDGDNFGDEDIDVECSCSGFAHAVFEDCSGQVRVDDEYLSADEVAQSCTQGLEDGGDDADTFRCYIEAACEAENCDQFASRLDLCGY